MDIREKHSDRFQDENNHNEHKIWTPTVDPRLFSQDRNPRRR
ncbi:hypothetical protein [Flavobacterium defluvii]|uniref:Uncharacterized protein n=1 Tax=Flavobacterium defluvii TaxID=370979 RepID=A0A1M5IRW6_9FLAO|nr:hypothetical protein [Flavobacterium defluvii]SHG30965.1 hypothetical protein SAMN05443663_102489 [Flavobacterium defluvii]